MTVSDFKQHLAKMMRERETGKKYFCVGAPPLNKALVRKKSYPKD